MLVSIVADGVGEVSHDQIYGTLIAAMIGWPTTVIGVLAWWQNRIHRRDRVEREQQRRDDLRSRQEAAEQLLTSNHHVAQIAAEVADRNDRSLAAIHILVNSNLTKAMESERAAVEQALGAITEAIDLKIAIGANVLPESYAAQAKLDEQLEALNAVIHERHLAIQEWDRSDRIEM